MNLNAHNKWRNAVIAHYGSLDNFPDARTIRIMRAGIITQLYEFASWVRNASIHDGQRTVDMFTQSSVELLQNVFGDDIVSAHIFVNEMENWLTKRNLEP